MKFTGVALLALAAPAARALVVGRTAPLRAMDVRMTTLPDGAPVVVVGGGAIQVLSARVAALRGHPTSIACIPSQVEIAKALLYDDLHPEGSMPIKILPIAGDEAVKAEIEAAIEEAQGLIFAFDSDKQFLPPTALDVFLPPGGGTQVKHVSLMSRYLNGAGMGFFPSAAKAGANAEIWNGDAKSIEAYREMEKAVGVRVRDLGATCTTIRAGTLKGGASGERSSGGEGGEPSFLNPAFYTYGQQDVSNWRLLYDCGVLEVELVKGDTLPGPGFTAALTAISPEGGQGDSHRGAVATALVEAMRCAAAADADFSVRSTPGRQFPQEGAWEALFAKA